MLKAKGHEEYMAKQNLPSELLAVFFAGPTHLTTSLAHTLTMYLNPATSYCTL